MAAMWPSNHSAIYRSLHLRLAIANELFSINSLLQEQRLNSKNYSKQKLFMEIFLESTDNDMNMHAKFQKIITYRPM
jgi:hypothetical protein